MGKTLTEKVMEPGKRIQAKESMKDVGSYIAFLSKKIFVRIHYPSGEVKTHKVKVAMRHIDIDGMSYLLHPDAFYREGKVYIIEYYYGNPRPIIYKYNDEGIIVPSKKLKNELIGEGITDSKGNAITYEIFEGLPYMKKVLFPGVMEVDATMFNRALTQKAARDLWGKDEGIRANKWIIFGILILIAVAITGFTMWRRLHGA